MSESKTSWVNVKPEEIEAKIVELAKKGVSPGRIGLILRDEHGIPKAKLLGLKVKKILIKSKHWVEPRHANLKTKTEKLSKHAAMHKHDYSATRSLTRNNQHLAKIEKKR